MKPKFQKLYSEMAVSVAKMSYARRLQVGAIIVKNDRVISMGYNGMPAGWDNNCEDTISQVVGVAPDGHDLVELTLKTKLEVLHAESNAIAKLAKTDGGGEGADIFVTHAPCIQCAKLIFQTGINRVFYGEDYRDDKGIKFLKQSGVKVIKNDE
jgi:dCMP deaminase